MLRCSSLPLERTIEIRTAPSNQDGGAATSSPCHHNGSAEKGIGRQSRPQQRTNATRADTYTDRQSVTDGAGAIGLRSSVRTVQAADRQRGDVVVVEGGRQKRARNGRLLLRPRARQAGGDADEQCMPHEMRREPHVIKI